MAFGIIPPFEKAMTVAYHVDSNGHKYFGYADKGATQTQAKWKIMKQEFTDSNWIMKYADGDDLFDNVWSNVESLTYKLLGT